MSTPLLLGIHGDLRWDSSALDLTSYDETCGGQVYYYNDYRIKISPVVCKRCDGTSFDFGYLDNGLITMVGIFGPEPTPDWTTIDYEMHEDPYDS